VAYVQKVLKNQTKDGDRLGGTLTVRAKVNQVGQASAFRCTRRVWAKVVARTLSCWLRQFSAVAFWE
jgi:hypothetical protein